MNGAFSHSNILIPQIQAIIKERIQHRIESIFKFLFLFFIFLPFLCCLLQEVFFIIKHQCSTLVEAVLSLHLNLCFRNCSIVVIELQSFSSMFWASSAGAVRTSCILLQFFITNVCFLNYKLETRLFKEFIINDTKYLRAFCCLFCVCSLSLLNFDESFISCSEQYLLL